VNKTNDRSRKELDAVEMEILGIRGELNAVKKDRDQVRDDNKELKRKQGFATNDLLLFDYEKRKASIDRAKDQIIDLQERYRVLSKQVMDYSHKISRGQMLLSAPSTSGSSPFTASGIRK
jgi:chromosome segregation ATPase